MTALRRATQLVACGLWMVGCTAIADLDGYTQDAGVADTGDGDGDAATAGDGDVGDGDVGDGDGDGDGGDGDGGDGDAMATDAGMEPDATMDAAIDEPVGNGCLNPLTFCMQLVGFEALEGLRVEADLVDGSQEIRARAVLDPLDVARPELVLPLAVRPDDLPADPQESNLVVQLWADTDPTNGVFDAASDDRWRVVVPSDGNISFAHDPTPVDLQNIEGLMGNLRVNFSGMGIHIGQMLELMVIAELSGATVGLYRLGEVPSAEFFIEINGIIEPGGVEYRLEAYADVDETGRYEADGKDHNWIVRTESDEVGLTFDFAHNAQEMDDLTYQFVFEDDPDVP